MWKSKALTSCLVSIVNTQPQQNKGWNTILSLSTCRPLDISANIVKKFAPPKMPLLSIGLGRIGTKIKLSYQLFSSLRMD